MDTVPVVQDAEAFASTGDCEPLGLTADQLYQRLPELVRDADLLCILGGADRPAGYAPVEIREGALLRYRISENDSLMLLLYKAGPRMKLTAIWPKLDSGSRLIARITGLIKSPEGTQAHAKLVLQGQPHADLCVYLSEYAFGAGLWERGGTYDFRVIGLPLHVGPADITPIRIGPDAPSHASMVAAGMKPESDGCITIHSQGMAAFFQRDDLAPNACEFRGTVTAIRDGGAFLGCPYCIADVTVFRSDDSDTEQRLSIAISETVWTDPARLAIGMDIQGVALLQAVAVGAIR